VNGHCLDIMNARRLSSAHGFIEYTSSHLANRSREKTQPSIIILECTKQ